MDLKCKKLNCANNNCYSCLSKAIVINKEIVCSDYKHNTNLPKEQQQDVSATMFETTPKYYPYRHNKSLSITCKTDCLFNNNGICVANGITIVNINNKPKCITHIHP